MKKKFMLSMPVLLHGAMRMRGFKEGKTLQAMILEACEKFMDTDETQISDEVAIEKSAPSATHKQLTQKQMEETRDSNVLDDEPF